MFTSEFAIRFMVDIRSAVSAKAWLKFWIAVSVSAFMYSPPSRSWGHVFFVGREQVIIVRHSPPVYASSRLPPEQRPLAQHPFGVPVKVASSSLTTSGPRPFRTSAGQSAMADTDASSVMKFSITAVTVAPLVFMTCAGNTEFAVRLRVPIPPLEAFDRPAELRSKS